MGAEEKAAEGLNSIGEGLNSIGVGLSDIAFVSFFYLIGTWIDHKMNKSSQKASRCYDCNRKLCSACCCCNQKVCSVCKG